MKAKELWLIIAVVLVAATMLFLFSETTNYFVDGAKEEKNQVVATEQKGVTLNAAPISFKVNPQTLRELKQHKLIIKNGVLTPQVNLNQKQVYIPFTGNSVVDEELKELQRVTANL